MPQKVYICSHFCQVSSIYLTIAATIERFLSVWMKQISHTFCTRKTSLVWCIFLLVFTFSATITKYFEIIVIFRHAVIFQI